MPPGSVSDTTTYAATAPGLAGRPASSAGAGLPFTVPTSVASVAGAAPAPAAASAVDGLLAMQEQAWETVRDRAARRHGRRMLDALTALQADALGEGGDAMALARLVEEPAEADDPRLASVLRAIRLRARIEIVRR